MKNTEIMYSMQKKYIIFGVFFVAFKKKHGILQMKVV